MKKIAFIIPYFGQFNNYFPLFMTSVKNNPTIDWYIFTDSNQDFECLLSPPTNVKLVRETFQEFSMRIRALFTYEISLENPYKLCDYRPAYGEALQDFISDYDFWGHCDCDLILGDIRRFLTEEILDAYPKIFTHGHMTLYRNETKVNEFYRKQTIIDVKQVFQSSDNHAFDEWPGVSGIWKKLGMIQCEERWMDDIRVGFKGLKPTKTAKEVWSTFNADVACKYKRMWHVIYAYKDGSLLRIWRDKRTQKVCREEILYVHLQRRPMEVLISSMSASEFLIRSDEFIEYEQVTEKSLEAICNEKYLLYNFLRSEYYKVEMLLRKMGLFKK